MDKQLFKVGETYYKLVHKEYDDELIGEKVWELLETIDKQDFKKQSETVLKEILSDIHFALSGDLII